MGKGIGAGGLILLIGVASAPAQEWSGRPWAGPIATLGRPVVELGQPIPCGEAPVLSGGPRAVFAESRVADPNLALVGSVNQPAAGQLVARGQSWDAPLSAPAAGQAAATVPVLGAPVPAAPGAANAPAPQWSAAAVPPPSPAWSAAAPPPDPFFSPAPPAGNPIPGPPLPPPSSGPGLFGYPQLGCTTGCGRSLFESDHCFDNFISPVTNPFLFEDPRALTEVRPIFIYQHTPRSNFPYQGGNLWFLGARASLAVTERLSFTINKFGGIWSDPNQGAPLFAPHVGFSEIWLAPKWTFWRDDQCGWLGATGVIFQVPSGPARVFQDSGHLSVVPYVSIGKEFFHDFHFLTTAGYALGDNRRTDYFYGSFHLDYNVGGLRHIYPLVELNWFHYTESGTSPLVTGFEGRDLVNFGARGIAGKDSLTLAFGGRYKFFGSDNFQTGLAFEFPLISSRDLLDFRLTWDFIIRY